MGYQNAGPDLGDIGITKARIDADSQRAGGALMRGGKRNEVGNHGKARIAGGGPGEPLRTRRV